MDKDNFQKNLKVDEKDLIPIAPKDRCLFVMECTARAFRLGDIMKEKGDEESAEYINYNYSINHILGELEYKLRKQKISEDEFKSSCEAVYKDYNLNFDVLRDNLIDLKKSDEYHKRIKEYVNKNYYKLKYTGDGNREKTELDIESEEFDSKLSNKLKIQAEKQREIKLARLQEESQTSKEDGRI